MSKFFKNFVLTLSIVSVLFSCMLPCFASSYKTHSDVLQNNSTINNLLSLRSDKQKNLHYIGFRNSSGQYLLVMSDDFQKSGNTVSANAVDIIFYDSDIGSSNSTRYFSTQQYDFSLTINHVVVSDFLDFSSKNDTSHWQNYLLILVALILAFVIFNVLRRFK